MAAPDLTIRTERTTLRPLTPRDAPALAEAVFADPDVAKTLVGDWSDPATRPDRARGWIESAQHWDLGYGMWGIHDTAGAVGAPGALIGFCAAEEAPMETARGPEIYYALCRVAWGQRLASEVVSALVGHLLTVARVPAIEALFYPEINEASVRIVRRLGFQFVGHFPVGAYVGDLTEETMAYDIWRMATYRGSEARVALSDTAFRLGLFVGEGAMAMEEAVQSLVGASEQGPVGRVIGGDEIARIVRRRLADGAAAAGFLHYRLEAA